MEILVEVCDPSGAAQWAYTVNGYLVSDFCTPNYYDPVGAAGVRYSFTGVLTEPRQMVEGGYLSWRDPATGDWWQGERDRWRAHVPAPRAARRGRPADPGAGRPVHADDPAVHGDVAPDDPALPDAYERRASTRVAAEARAAAVRARMADLGLG